MYVILKGPILYKKKIFLSFQTKYGYVQTAGKGDSNQPKSHEIWSFPEAIWVFLIWELNLIFWKATSDIQIGIDATLMSLYSLNSALDGSMVNKKIHKSHY